MLLESDHRDPLSRAHDPMTIRHYKLLVLYNTTISVVVILLAFVYIGYAHRIQRWC